MHHTTSKAKKLYLPGQKALESNFTKTEKMKTSNKVFLLSTEKSLSLLLYKVIYQVDDGERFIRAFNILRDGKVIQKIYMPEPVRATSDLETDIIITDLILQKLEKSDDPKFAAKRKQYSTKNTVNNQARAQVFNDFITNSDF